MKLTKILMVGICPLALAATPVLAQSTGSERVETVVVTGLRISMDLGLGSATVVSKQNSVVTQEFIDTQFAGQTFFEDLNALPGFNFENKDAYGNSGGYISMHGQAGDHVSVTLDGLPLNDTGNYAMYSNQMVDPELIGKVTVNQGTTDVDSPTAAVTGGTIAVRTVRPDEDFSVYATLSTGSESYKRIFGRIDSGAFGPFGTRAFFAGSYTNYDKFRGYGEMDKKQFNAAIYQDMGRAGWMMLAAHWNVNRNNSYWGIYYTGGSIDWDNLYSNASGNVYGKSCDFGTPTQGTADTTGCSSWYKTGINPSDTGNIRFSSLWNLASNLTLTLDGSLEFVMANGGGTTSMYETSAQLIGSTTGGGSSSDTVSAYGCEAGVGCDLNGDGDLLDKVYVANPSNTNTRRWGFNANLIFRYDEQNMFRWAYTLDYGIHRQTGQRAYLNPQRGYYSSWGGWGDDAHKIVTADGTDLRKRDRSSRAILNQLAFEYVGNYLNDTLGANIGFRLPFFQRDLDERCYEEIGYSSYPLCTTEEPESISDNGIVTFASSSYEFVMPGKKTVYYSKFLPHVGFSYKPFGDENLIFVNYTQELAAPKTDNLYTASGTLYSATDTTQYAAFETVKPETSTSYTLGYRYLGEVVSGSLSLWNNQVRNRIVSSYDEETGGSTYRNVSGINYAGIDADLSYRILENLDLYGSVSYTSARIGENVAMKSYASAYTKGKQFSNTPKWTFAGRVQYKPLPELRIGMNVKYVGIRYATDDNNVRIPDYYRVDADIAYSFDRFGWDGARLKFNVKNLFDKAYISGFASYACYTGSSGCSSKPYVYPGAPRTFMVSLSAEY